MSLMNTLLQKAVSKQDVLFPDIAVEWLKTAYKGRLEQMCPKTIYNKVQDLCLKNGYEADELEIIEAVNDYIYS